MSFARRTILIARRYDSTDLLYVVRYTLYTRNKRKIPLYPDDVVWPEARWKLLLKRLWKMLCDCCFNTVTLPCVVLAYLFRDKAALEAIKGRRGRQSHSHATLYILYG